jgi:hypothetical protein
MNEQIGLFESVLRRYRGRNDAQRPLKGPPCSNAASACARIVRLKAW